MKYENENDKAWYELVHWPLDHDCAPSATSHLARIFRERCFNAVESDPTKSIFQSSMMQKNVVPEKKTSSEKIF